MNVKDYRYICKVCDKFLLNPNAKLSTIAISYLHVIREHPIFTEKYKKIFERINFFLPKYFISLTRLLLLVIARFFKRFFLKSNDLEIFGKISERTDLVVVSHLINEKYLERKDDFYLGELQNNSKFLNKNILLVLLNHTNISEKLLSKRYGKNVCIPKIILGETLSIKNEFKNLKICIRESISLQNHIIPKNEKETNMIKVCSLEALSFSTLANLRIGDQIKKIVEKYKPKAILTTFEGHAYERIIYASARKINPLIKCLAFQHTRVFPLQHAMLRDLNVKYNPDIIFTSGKNSYSHIQKRKKNKKIKVEILGSPTFYKYQKSITEEDYIIKKGTQDFCIVMPEGYISETLTLFDFIIEASKNSSINFIFRLHPLINVTQLCYLRPKFKSEEYKNIIISNTNLDIDLSKSKWILYRGSTGVLRAIKRGIIPIYLKISNDELNIDPLFDLSDSKYEIQSIKDLNKIFNKTNYKKIILRKSNKSFYNKFLNNVYSKFKINTLIKHF